MDGAPDAAVIGVISIVAEKEVAHRRNSEALLVARSDLRIACGEKGAGSQILLAKLKDRTCVCNLGSSRGTGLYGFPVQDEVAIANLESVAGEPDHTLDEVVARPFRFPVDGCDSRAVARDLEHDDISTPGLPL